MRHYLSLAAITTAITLSSCFRAEVNDPTDTSDTSNTSNTNTKAVQFIMKGITEDYSAMTASTRATLASANITDLWVIEGNTLLKHQVSTDSDFGTPTLSLSYGTHDLTFIASKADNQSWSNGTWTTTKESDTFATVMTATVSGNSSNSRQVQLTRRTSKFKFTTEDIVPTTVKKLHLTVHNHKSLDASLVGGSPYTHEATVDLTAKAGSVYSASVNILTQSATDEEDTAIVIEFLDSNDSPLYHYERTVKLKPNRCTSMSGKFFQGESNQVSIVADWDTDLDVPLFQPAD